MKRRPWPRLASMVALAPLAAMGQPARVDDITARIVGGESASAVLQQWCAARGLPALSARRVRGADKAPEGSVRAALSLRPGETIRYRRVSLRCGEEVLSEADNWYLPARLTPDMNQRLDTTDAPFGLVVQPLRFTRKTLGVRRSRGASHVFEVRAVLVTASGAPFSYVVEDYNRELTVPPSP